MVIIMLLAAMQAAQLVGWTAFTVAIGAVGLQLVQIVIGLIIIGIGVYLANLAARFIGGMETPNRRFLALIARVAIISFAGAMGLTAMGLAEQIVILAFGLFMGSIAVAVAIAYGLGGRETASRQVAGWAAALSEGDIMPAQKELPEPATSDVQPEVPSTQAVEEASSKDGEVPMSNPETSSET
jgi:hypothetical protein